MDLEDIVLSEMSDTEGQTLHHLTYMWHLQESNTLQSTEWWLPGAAEEETGADGKWYDAPVTQDQ